MALPNPSLGMNRAKQLFVRFMYRQCPRAFSTTNPTLQVMRVIRPPPATTSSSTFEAITPGRIILFALVGGAAGSSVLYLMSKSEKSGGLFSRITSQSSLGSSTVEVAEKRKLTPREKRFIKFASVEYDGQIYMTPQDLLESVVEGEPRPRFKRKKLNIEEVKEMLHEMPKLKSNNDAFFRGLGNNGLISYSEYLFLLTILIKPQSGFKIAFAMLDQDGNQNIDKTEFKVLETVFSSAARERKEQQLEESTDQIEEKSSKEEGGDDLKVVIKEAKAAAGFDDIEHGLHRTHSAKVDTSLLIYFFGQRGDGQLGFDEFKKFMDNLQTEVLAMEYNEFAKGATTITEIDFARILLRYTFLHAEEYELILERLVQRMAADPDSADRLLRGISFDEFKDFCLFLNNLDDFQIAMRMYTLADKSITPEEFSRAVTVCTGRQLAKHLVKTVFQIFDDDGDGLLSYQEFVAMMKDRVNRGLKSYSRQEGWTGFKRCVKQEVSAGQK